MSFVTPAPVAYLTRTSTFPLAGLVALYNIANTASYTSGSSTIYDLSGQGNTLTISGSSITYVAASSSLQFSGSSAAAFGQIKSNNELVYNGTYPLETTGSQFTIVAFVQSVLGGAYEPLWYVGPTTYSTTLYKRIMNVDFNSFGPWKIGIGSEKLPGLTYDAFTAFYSSSITNFYTWNSTNFASRKWSMQSYAKSSQTSDFNLNITVRGYNTGSSWDSSSLSVVPLSTGSYPRINGADGQTGYLTNLDTSYLYIGKTPATSTNPFLTFQFGGMAIYNRPLTTGEISNLWDYFIAGRTA